MANISNKTESYTRSKAAGRRLYLALKVKGISRTKKGLFSDEEWIGRNLPKTAKSLSAWFEDGVPIYSKGKDIRPIKAIADYFRVDEKYFTNERDIDDEVFLNKIVATPTMTELAKEDFSPRADTKVSPAPAPVEAGGDRDVYSEFYRSLREIFRDDPKGEKPFDFYKSLLSKKIGRDITNYRESSFIEITNIHRMPLMWNECHDHIKKSLIMSSYAAVDQWVNHPNSRRAFESEARLTARGVDIKRIYIVDSTEEWDLLLKTENVLFQLRENIQLRFIHRREIRDYYYIKDIIASIEALDVGLIDETWLVIAFLDITRNPMKMKLCWDPNKIEEHRIFLNELWHISHPVENKSP